MSACQQDFLKIAEGLCQHYMLDYASLRYDGEDITQTHSERFCRDAVFFAQQLSFMLNHVYTSNIIVAFEPEQYAVLEKEQATDSQLALIREYYQQYGLNIKSEIFDRFIEFAAIRTMLFYAENHTTVTPIHYPVHIGEDVYVNDVCAISYERFQHPSRQALYHFAQEMTADIQSEPIFNDDTIGMDISNDI